MGENLAFTRRGWRWGLQLPEPDGDLDPMLGNTRGSRVVKAILLAIVIALALVFWVGSRFVQNHLGAAALLEARGARVRWEISSENWTKGGVTRVSRPPAPQSVIQQKQWKPIIANAIRASDLAELLHLHHPVQLDLAGIPITNATLVHLEGLESLEKLDLRGGSLEQAYDPQVTNAPLVHLRGLRRLETLTLADRAVNDAGLAILAGLTSLKSLDLAGSQVSDAGMRHLLSMVRLEELDLHGTALTNKGLLQLAALPALKTLNVSETNVTLQGVFKLLQLRPDLDVSYDQMDEATDTTNR